MSRMAVAAVLLAVCAATAGRADAPRHAVLIPPELGGFYALRDQYRRELVLNLEQRLRAGQVVVTSPSKGEADCHEFDCMIRLADSFRADLVIDARVVNNMSVKLNYALRVRVVERTGTTPATRERQQSCDNCTEADVRNMLVKLMSATIANEPEPQPATPTSPVVATPLSSPRDGSPAPSTAPAVLTPATITPPPAVEDSRRSMRSERKVFLALAAVGLAGVAAGVATVLAERFAVDGTCATTVAAGERCPVVVDARNGMIAGGVVAVGGAATAAVFFGLAHRELKKDRALWFAPTAGARGGGAVLGGRF